MLILSCYAFFLLLLSFWEFRKKEGLNSFLIANRNASTLQIAFSMIATCVGGTATIGVIGNVMNKGFPAVWWLFSGAIGLTILALSLTRIVYRTGAMTLPEIAQHFISHRARTISATIICVAWCSILSAQFLACAQIISAFGISLNIALFLAAITITLYTALGGQTCVIKSDVYQYLLVIIAFVGVLLWLLGTHFDVMKNINFELINEHFGYLDIGYYLLFIGVSYVIDPMLFSRILSAKNEKAALHGAILGAIGIAISGILIVCVGFGAISLIGNEVLPDQLLTHGLIHKLPSLLGLLLLLGLLSAIISSADTCLFTASTVFSHDIIRTNKLYLHRIMTVFFGTIALFLASQGNSILNYLLAANDIFVAGVAVPLFFSMIFKGKVNSKLIITAMICAGSLGLISSLGSILDAGGRYDSKIYSCIGIGLSFILSISARLIYKQKQ